MAKKVLTIILPLLVEHVCACMNFGKTKKSKLVFQLQVELVHMHKVSCWGNKISVAYSISTGFSGILCLNSIPVLAEAYYFSEQNFSQQSALK